MPIAPIPRREGEPGHRMVLDRVVPARPDHGGETTGTTRPAAARCRLQRAVEHVAELGLQRVGPLGVVLTEAGQTGAAQRQGEVALDPAGLLGDGVVQPEQAAERAPVGERRQLVDGHDDRHHPALGVEPGEPEAARGEDGRVEQRGPALGQLGGGGDGDVGEGRARHAATVAAPATPDGAVHRGPGRPQLSTSSAAPRGSEVLGRRAEQRRQQPADRRPQVVGAPPGHRRAGGAAPAGTARRTSRRPWRRHASGARRARRSGRRSARSSAPGSGRCRTSARNDSSNMH